MIKETVILKYIYKNSSIRQRDLADAASMSLGMTNAILKDMEKNGFISLIKTNSRKMSYQLTEIGLARLRADLVLDVSEFNSKMKYYSEALEKVIIKKAGEKIQKIIISASSPLYIIVEYMCLKNRLEILDSSFEGEKSDVVMIDHEIEELFIQSLTENFDRKGI